MAKVSNLQVLEAPIQTTQSLDDFISTQQHQAIWHSLVILSSPQSTLLLLLTEEEAIIQILRICLSDKQEIIDALKKFNGKKAKITCVETAKLSSITDLSEIQTILTDTPTKQLTYKKSYEHFFDHKQPIEGRGDRITAATARQVTFESHGYCMYEGCGLNLNIDDITSIKGNYGYLAHIIASSPKGPRGNERSHELSDDANNIMMLCDKHHRLIDKIAPDEYTEDRLLKMKADFSVSITDFLSGLAYQEVPTYTAFWPIGGTLPDEPTPQEYSASLNPACCRPSRVKRHLYELNHHDKQSEQWWASQAPYQLNTIGNDFKRFSKYHRQKAGIFALGPCSMLIGLGAVLGNKNSLCIVPRSRKHGWGWTRKTPLAEPFTTHYTDVELKTTEEIVVALFTTDIPSECQTFIDHYEKNNIPTIRIKACVENNDSLSHPKESNVFRELITNLLHDLRNLQGVRKVHLLPCASNATCIEMGRAIEHNHPQVRIYDSYHSESKKYFVPRLDLIPAKDEVTVKAIDSEVVQQYHQQFGKLAEINH